MAENPPRKMPAQSPFYCLAVPVAPREGESRIALFRLQELSRGFNRLVRLRWWAAGALAVAGLVSRYVLDPPPNTSALLMLACAVCAYNAFFRRFSAFQQDAADVHETLRRLAALTVAQLAADVLAGALLVHLAGGIENPLLFVLVLHVILAAVLLSRAASVWLAALSVALIAVVALSEYAGWLAHRTLWSEPLALHMSTRYVAAVLAAYAAAAFLAALLAGNIVDKLRHREAELVNLTASLEKGTLQLSEAYEQIKALEERKSTFLRTASHQLRGPLSAMKSLLEIVVQGYAADPEKQLELLQRARDRTDSMIRMTSEMLTLSRLKDADAALSQEPAKVNVCEVLSQVEAFFAAKATAKGVRLEVTAPPQSCTALASGDDLREALGNLLDNAINYTPAGGSVTCRAALEDGGLVVRIADTGIGIEKEDVDRVFDEFYRAPNAKKIDSDGTGLGLAIVKRIVEKWRGSISVESRPGEGTTFTVRFPTA